MEHLQKIQSQEQPPQKQSACAYNIALIKSYVVQSKLTVIAFCVCVVMFIIEVILTYMSAPSSGSFGILKIYPNTLIQMGANVPYYVKNGGVFRLISAMFLHAGLLHIVMNLSSLILFCMNVEKSVTKLVYGLAYILSGIQGNLMSDCYNVRLGNVSVIAVGASTSICGIIGLYLAKLYCDSKVNGNADFAKMQITSMLVYVLLISLFPGVDFFGHFGGLIGGALIGLSFCQDVEALKKIKWIGRVLMVVFWVLLMTMFI